MKRPGSLELTTAALLALFLVLVAAFPVVSVGAFAARWLGLW